MKFREFSLQCLCDGRTVIPTIPVRDHKRRFENDEGPNTGGQGSYSDANHLLPFLVQSDVDQGLRIVRLVAEALLHKYGVPYKGIIYAGCMSTVKGTKIIEFNVRFGDSEAMNVLPILQTDFMEICWAIVKGKLNEIDVTFKKKATVVKYVVPKGYGLPKDHPDATPPSTQIYLDAMPEGAELYYSSVEEKDGGLFMTSSRAIAVLGIGDDLPAAERIAEIGAQGIHGYVDHRSDIGTQGLISKSIEHMKALRG